MGPTTSGNRRAGRPSAEAAIPEAVLLDAALRAFATYGYDGVSVRTLNRELGVSHNLINQRFGSKQGLWRAAVDYGFGDLVRHMEGVFDPTLTDPLDQLALVIGAFLRFSAEHPYLLGLMDIEGRLESHRLAYIYDHYIAPALAGVGRLLDHLVAGGRIRPIPLRSLHFLIAHGAAAPFTLVPLAERFDHSNPLAPRNVERHANLISEIIINGLRIADPPSEQDP
jgi:TetR/AcrR family transcriptional regulator